MNVSGHIASLPSFRSSGDYPAKETNLPSLVSLFQSWFGSTEAGFEDVIGVLGQDLFGASGLYSGVGVVPGCLCLEAWRSEGGKRRKKENKWDQKNKRR